MNFNYSSHFMKICDYNKRWVTALMRNSISIVITFPHVDLTICQIETKFKVIHSSNIQLATLIE